MHTPAQVQASNMWEHAPGGSLEPPVMKVDVPTQGRIYRVVWLGFAKIWLGRDPFPTLCLMQLMPPIALTPSPMPRWGEFLTELYGGMDRAIR